MAGRPRQKLNPFQKDCIECFAAKLSQCGTSDDEESDVSVADPDYGSNNDIDIDYEESVISDISLNQQIVFCVPH